MDQRVLQKLLANAQKNKKLLQQRMNEIESSIFISSTCNHLIEIKAKGNYEITECNINEEILKDKETLQDLIISATNEVIKKIHDEILKAEKEFIPKGFA